MLEGRIIETEAALVFSRLDFGLEIQVASQIKSWGPLHGDPTEIFPAKLPSAHPCVRHHMVWKVSWNQPFEVMGYMKSLNPPSTCEIHQAVTTLHPGSSPLFSSL